MIIRSLSHQGDISLSSMWKLNKPSVRVIAFIAITLTAIILRLCISFSHDLILGIDGGYYPVQVRNILNTGFLSFKDVPLYFYFCASIVKFISLLGFAVTNEVIISVIKIVDSIALPLLAIPLFKIMTKKDQKLPLSSELAILLFAIFSFSPFVMLGDIQKNAFAIMLLVAFIYRLETYLTISSRKNLAVVCLVLFLIAITHFGVFTMGMTFLLISLFIVYRKKAILSSLVTIIVGIVIIYLFDSSRAYRLINFYTEIFGGHIDFEGPFMVPLLINGLLSYTLAIFAIYQYRKHKHKADKATGYMILSLIVLIFIFAFPFYDTQYVQRFNVLLFVPQSLLIIYLIRINQKIARPVSISLTLLTLIFIFIYVIEDKKPCIDELAYQDLKNIKKYLPANRENTIVITRHGIEFWTAWSLSTKVGNDRSLEKLGIDNYKNIIFLQYKIEDRQRPMDRRRLRKSENGDKRHPPMGAPMGSPVPENAKLIYSSSYFNAYQKLN